MYICLQGAGKNDQTGKMWLCSNLYIFLAEILLSYVAESSPQVCRFLLK